MYIPAELLKALGSKRKHELFVIYKQIYNQGEWPDDFMESIVILIEKKSGAKECVNFTIICSVTHASQTLLKMMQHRLEPKAKAFLDNDQFGFRRGCGTRDGIATLRSIYERRLEHNKVYVCFVDYEKTFDRVNWIQMMEILNDIGVVWRDRKLIMNLYNKQSVFVRIGESLSESCMIGRGVRQGCTLSPLLCNLYDEAMMREALYEIECGIKVGGHMIKTVRIADDKAVVASSEKGLQELMDNINRVTQKYGIKINVKKTKVMCSARQGGRKVEILIDGQKVEQVNHFKYLSTVISDDGYCEEDVRCRIAMAKKAFMEKKKVADKQIEYESEEKNSTEYHLECCTVCSRDLDTDGNLEEEVRSF